MSSESQMREVQAGLQVQSPAEELSAALQRYCLSHAEFARLMDVTQRAVYNWTHGKRDVPGPVRAYLRLWVAAEDVARGSELLWLKGIGR